MLHCPCCGTLRAVHWDMLLYNRIAEFVRFEGTSRLYIRIPNGERKLPICMQVRYDVLYSYLSIVPPFLSGKVSSLLVLLLILGLRFKLEDFWFVLHCSVVVLIQG